MEHIKALINDYCEKSLRERFLSNIFVSDLDNPISFSSIVTAYENHDWLKKQNFLRQTGRIEK